MINQSGWKDTPDVTDLRSTLFIGSHGVQKFR